MTSRAPDVSYQEYLESEAHSLTKHEYLRGQILDMAGGTIEHGALTIAVAALLVTGLRGRPCRVLSSDVRVRVDASDFTAYPDLSVVCGEVRPSSLDPHAFTNPILLVEVLSESSEAYDRGAKFAHYRQLESLQEYLLVGQGEPLLELYRRNAEGHWVLFEAHSGQKLEVQGVELDVDTIYRDPLGA